MRRSRFVRLISEYLDGEISASDKALLFEEVRKSEKNRQLFESYSRLDSAVVRARFDAAENKVVQMPAQSGSASANRAAGLLNVGMSWCLGGAAAGVMLALGIGYVRDSGGDLENTVAKHRVSLEEEEASAPITIPIEAMEASLAKMPINLVKNGPSEKMQVNENEGNSGQGYEDCILSQSVTAESFAKLMQKILPKANNTDVADFAVFPVEEDVSSTVVQEIGPAHGIFIFPGMSFSRTGENDQQGGSYFENRSRPLPQIELTHRKSSGNVEINFRNGGLVPPPPPPPR